MTLIMHSPITTVLFVSGLIDSLLELEPKYLTLDVSFPTVGYDTWSNEK